MVSMSQELGADGDATDSPERQGGFGPPPGYMYAPAPEEPEDSPRRVPEDETEHSRVPESLQNFDWSTGGLQTPGPEGPREPTEVEPETESPNKSNLAVPTEQPTHPTAGALLAAGRDPGGGAAAAEAESSVLQRQRGVFGSPPSGAVNLPPAPTGEFPLLGRSGSIAELPELPPDDEVEHVVVPLARGSGKAAFAEAGIPQGGAGGGAEPGGNAAGDGGGGGAGGGEQGAAEKPKRRPKEQPPRGLCGASLLDRGLFVVEDDGPENFPVLKPCPGKKDQLDRRGLQYRGRGRPRASPGKSDPQGAGGKEFLTAADEKEEEKNPERSSSRQRRGISPCPGAAAEEEGEEEGKKAKTKSKRTWTYYPPPNGDEDAVPVDVIDHESEVLIVRRDPPPQTRRQIAMSVNVTHRSHSPTPPREKKGLPAKPKGQEFLV